MTTRDAPRAISREGQPSRSWLARAARSDTAWLAVAVAASSAVYLSYLTTHSYPAYGAGLFLETAERISANGYALPRTIPHYTAEGIPFAYPPLMFVVAAVVRDLTGVGPVAYARYVPGLLTVAYLVPYYYLARELLASRPRAGVATVLFAVAPPVLQWHLSAGGIVRTGSFLFALAGVYTGVRLFRTGDRWWVVPSAVLFALTVLSHPTYAAFFALSYLVAYATLDRSLGGLLDGALVGLGGLVLASPWVWTVLRAHGADVFVAAAGTHGGIGGGVGEILKRVSRPPRATATDLLGLFVLATGGYLLSKGRVLLPVWTVAAAMVLADSRFLYVAGIMAVVVLVFEALVPTVERGVGRFVDPRVASVIVVGLLTVAAVGTGVLFAASAVDTHGQTRSQPQFIDDADREAMSWARSHTDPDARFVVLGDAAEWFPYFADRTLLVGPWGVEWQSADRYRRQLELYRRLATCQGEPCVTGILQRADVRPGYLYVSKGEYTVRGFVHERSERMRRTLVASDRYEVRFENEGAMIVRVVSPGARADPDRRLAATPGSIRSGTG